MSTRHSVLADEARYFADDLSALLNGTVTRRIRISAALRSDGRAFVGYGITKRCWEALPIELQTPQTRTSLYLFVAYTLHLNEQNHQFMTVTKSTYSIGTSATESAFRYDYVSNASNEYPDAHLHILGESERLAALVRAGRRERDPSRLHLPVGGRRFRPCLEDIIEFCIVEQLVEPQHDMWEEKLNAHRDRFYRRQLKAAVRQYPATARSVLEHRP